MENWISHKKLLIIGGLLLTLTLLSGGYLAGRLHQMGIYHANLERIADINPCHA